MAHDLFGLLLKAFNPVKFTHRFQQLFPISLPKTSTEDRKTNSAGRWRNSQQHRSLNCRLINCYWRKVSGICRRAPPPARRGVCECCVFGCRRRTPATLRSRTKFRISHMTKRDGRFANTSFKCKVQIYMTYIKFFY